eukprot:scaffold3289_cov362-Prasinococcus_capsulatus_cf.AAC.6
MLERLQSQSTTVAVPSGVTGARRARGRPRFLRHVVSRQLVQSQQDRARYTISFRAHLQRPRPHLAHRPAAPFRGQHQRARARARPRSSRPRAALCGPRLHPAPPHVRPRPLAVVQPPHAHARARSGRTAAAPDVGASRETCDAHAAPRADSMPAPGAPHGNINLAR